MSEVTDNIAERLAVQNFVQVNGTDICWFEWGTNSPDEETILLVHATGFHARCWDQVVRHLEGKHVIAIDQRGHGRSHNTPPFTWKSFGEDAIELIRSLDLNNIVGVGHSMGGHCIIQAAYVEPDRFARLVLVDPVVMSPEFYRAQKPEHSTWLDENGVHPVARRKNSFADADAMFANFQGRGSYGLWREDVLRDYCQYGVLPDPDGSGCVLACPPDVEAAVYMGSASEDLYDCIGNIDIPVKILRAKERDVTREEMDFSASPTWPGLAECFPNGRDVYLPDLTHFIPMQEPEMVARHILSQSLP